MNGHQEVALYDTGADVCCTSTKTFRKWYPNPDKRPKKLNLVSNVHAANGQKLPCDGIYALPFTIDGKQFTHKVSVFPTLNRGMIMGNDFFCEYGLGYDPSSQELYWTEKAGLEWSIADLQNSERITLEPTSNKVVTLNVITKRGYRVAEAGDAVAAISSQEHIVQGGPALVRVNRLGQTSMEIFNCTNSVMIIEKNAVLGLIENLRSGDTIGELNASDLTVKIEEQEPVVQQPISEEKKKYILDNAKLNVPEEFKQRYLDLLLKHHTVVSNNKYDLGKCTTSMMDIELKSQEPIYIKQFRIPEAQRQSVQDYVEELLKLGVVRPSKSKFNSPIFVVKKKDGGLRIVQDFRAINQQTLVDKYSMRDVQECIDEIGRAGSTIFSTIDLTSGFWQMMLNPECRKYTAFTLPGLGQFEWNASPMGLLGAPGSFQRLMEIVIHNLKNVLAYIDDLLVHTKDHKQHLEILEELFTRLRKHGLKINLPKSFFGAVEVAYLGFKLTPEGIKPGTDKLKAVALAPPPNDIHEVRQFLGLCNFFRGHVRNFAQVTAPLNELTRKDCEWKKGPLPPAAAQAFQELKTILVSQPVVHYPQPELPYALITDACQGDAKKPGGYGAILAQIQPSGEFQVISYASRKLKCHEKNYAPFLLEMSASVWGMEHFSVYLRGKHFVLYTDHKPLVKLGLVHNKTLNRMQEAMNEYDFEIIYQKGSEMPADYLSRNVVDVIQIDDEEIIQAQNDTVWIKQVKSNMLNNTLVTDEKAKICLRNYGGNRFFIENDLLWVRFQYRGEPHRVCLVLPESKVNQVLKEGHGTLFTGHEGVAKTRYRITQNYWWPSMDKDIGEFIKSCGKCQATRTDVHPKPDVMTSLPICTEPNQRIHADLFGALTASDKNKKYILCMTDAFTKYVELVAIPNKEAGTVADAIFSHWLCRYGIPMELITDQGKEFCNKLSDELFKLMEMKHGRTSAYHPQCNSQAEVANKTIAKYLRNVVDTSTLDWENYLAPLMFSYNTSFHRTIQTSPYFLTFGQIARQPAFNQGDWNKKYLGESSAAEKFQTLQLARQIAWNNSAHQQEENRKIYDRQAQPHDYHKGQYVLLKEENFLHKNRKLAMKYKGPYEIIKVKPHNNIEISVGKRQTMIVHVNRVKPYYDDSKFQTFPDNFEKQGGDSEVDFPPKTKFEKAKEQKTEKRKRGRPRKQKAKETSSEAESESEPESENEKPPRYELRRTNNVTLSRPIVESENARTESEGERDMISEYETESEEEEQIIQSISLKQSINLIKNKLIKINSMENPFIKECRKLIKALPKGLMKKEYPHWNEAQVINYWWSGDIMEQPEEIGVSLQENPYVPASILLRGYNPNLENNLDQVPPQVLPAQPNVPAPVLPVERVGPNPFGALRHRHEVQVNPQTLPAQTAHQAGPTAGPSGVPPATDRTASSGVPSNPARSPADFQDYNRANVRPELRAAAFVDASQMRDLNPDEQEHFRRAFYIRNRASDLQTEEGRPTRTNPSGLRTFFGKPKTKK